MLVSKTGFNHCELPSATTCVAWFMHQDVCVCVSMQLDSVRPRPAVIEVTARVM
jgi:hypothetical protein